MNFNNLKFNKLIDAEGKNFWRKNSTGSSQLLPILIMLAASLLILLAGQACLSFFTVEASYFSADIDPAREMGRSDYEFKEKFNVIVAGSDPEGISAALASARNGLKTLLIDEREKPGGLMVQGGLNTVDMSYGPDGKILTRGIFLEFFEQLEGTSFNTETAAKVFEDMIAEEENLTWKGGYNLIEPLLDGSRVVGISVKSEEKSNEIKYGAQRMIDATQDADMAAEAGVPYTRGMEDIGREDAFQAATLVFELENIDWQRAKEHLNTDGNPHSGGDDRSLWGFSREMQLYESRDPGIKVRGLNVGRQEDDRGLINSLHIVDIDPLDEESRREGRRRAEEELEYIVKHIRENIPGFSRAELRDTADELYIRQARQIKGESRLNINHVREHVDFPDKIALGSYPVDIQRTSRHDQGFVLFDPVKYSIPFGALVPREVDDLLVVGKSASFCSLAHGSARVIPVGMVAGEAAGAASRISLENEQDFREMAESEETISLLQSRLEKQGAYLEDFSHPPAGGGGDSWAKEGIRYFNSLGLLIAGYENEYGFEKDMSEREFYNRLRQALSRGGGVENISLPAGSTDEYITEEKALTSLSEIAASLENISSERVKDEEFLSSATAEKLGASDVLTRQASYQLIMEFMQAGGFKENK